MRKTSQDGTDSTSLTNGLDNDLRRPGTSTNKIKKTSIKRKVPNYSNDSDDATTQPLLKTEKEHSVVANESAKYSLNKSKTECLLEKDTKPRVSTPVSSPNNVTNNIILENQPSPSFISETRKDTKPRVSTPVSSPNNVTNNIILENQPSPSSISATAPIYNHMNVNILSELDLKKLDFPIGKSIILEIGGGKAVCLGPSPMIFTTAKIHADTKTEVMELLKATSNEGDEVKTGIHENDQRHPTKQPNKQDVSKNVGYKTDFNVGPSNFNEVLTNKTLSNSIQTKNLETIKKEINVQDQFENAMKNAKSKEQKLSLKTSNANSVDPISPIPKVTSDDTVMTKQIIANSTCKANGGFISDSSKQLIGTKSTTSDKNTNKSKGLSHNEKIDLNQTSQSCASSSKQINKSNINTPQKTKTDNTMGISTGSKKLQRQKNASIEEIKEINCKGLNNVTTVKNSAILDKSVCPTIDSKSDSATLHKSSTPITTASTKGSTPAVTSGIPPKTLNSSSINPAICKSSVPTETSAPINDKPFTETVKTKPGPSKIPEPSGKLAMKTPASNTAVVSTVMSSKTSITSTAKSTKVIDTSAAKQDFRSISDLPSKITKTEQATTSSVASSLPLYIVSTSKTKIGSPSTPSTSMVTNKTLEQKPISEIVNTDGKTGKLLMSTSQSKQSSFKPKITIHDSVQKNDDRA